MKQKYQKSPWAEITPFNLIIYSFIGLRKFEINKGFAADDKQDRRLEKGLKNAKKSRIFNGCDKKTLLITT